MDPGGADPRKRRRLVLAARARALPAAGCLLLACGRAPLPEPELAPLRLPRASFPSAECQRRAEALLAEMTTGEKVGQLIIADADVTRRAEVAAFSIGGVLAPSVTTPAAAAPQAWLDRATRFHEAGERAGLRIPLLYAVDSIRGAADMQGAVLFPAPIALGATGDAQLVARVYAAIARELAATGADLVLAPVVSAPRDAHASAAFEAFGADPGLVAELSGAAIRGLQGVEPAREAGVVLACARAGVGGSADLTPEALRRLELASLRAAVESHAACILVADERLSGERSALHSEPLSSLVKDELGFGGFVLTPWSTVSGAKGTLRDQLTDALEAGSDVLLAPPEPESVLKQLRELSDEGVATSRIEDATFRVLATKCEIGLLKPERRGREPLGVVGSAEHRALAREAVARSVVLLRNQRQLLPIARKSVIQLVGSKANDLGSQCGGTDGLHARERLVGTTIERAFEREVGAGHLRTMRTAQPSRGAWLSVAVVGEAAQSASGGAALPELDPVDVELVAALRKNGLPVLVIVLAGRPIPLPPAVAGADAVLVAWLPGTEASGLTDVIFGRRPFTARLSHAWPSYGVAPGPASAEASGTLPPGRPNAGDPGLDPAYPLGFGLGR